MKETNIDLYDYNLPQNLIAQTPLKKRDDSNLLVMDKNGILHDRSFSDIKNYLTKKDVLVLNNTKVLPARIIGKKENTGASIELLLLKNLGSDVWECLVKPQKRVSNGTKINFNDFLSCEVLEKKEMGITLVKFSYNGIFIEQLQKVGVMPLPPYIHETLKDNNRYQTVYAKILGSAAAPTAGLHFTKKLLNEIKKNGTKILYVTLNVGLGTFRPVEEDDITKHKMHTETYEIDKYTASYLNKAKNDGKRIVCVGTTVVRTLESNYKKYGCFKSTNEDTNIFIYPGYKFSVVDGIITNFHLPKSSLIMLVSAFMGRKKIMASYNHAVKNNYRFFSFGDAMYLTKKITFNKEYKKILEQYNKKTADYEGKYFTVFKGENNILISSPHAGRHIRKGKVKIREYGTSKIAQLLNYYKNVHIIYTKKDYDEDASRDDNSLYKEYLYDYIRENKIKYFIDLHGIESNDAVSVEIGTNNYVNINKSLINNIVKCFELNKINKVVIDKKYKGSTKTLSGKVNRDFDITTIQFEINKKYRKIHNKPQSFYKIINSFILVIDEFLKEK